MNVTKIPIPGADWPGITIYFGERDSQEYKALVTALKSAAGVPVDPTRKHIKKILKLLGEKVPD